VAEPRSIHRPPPPASAEILGPRLNERDQLFAFPRLAGWLALRDRPPRRATVPAASSDLGGSLAQPPSVTERPRELIFLAQLGYAVVDYGLNRGRFG
jgi:hypothetical protein